MATRRPSRRCGRPFRCGCRPAPRPPSIGRRRGGRACTPGPARPGRSKSRPATPDGRRSDAGSRCPRHRASPKSVRGGAIRNAPRCRRRTRRRAAWWGRRRRRMADRRRSGATPDRSSGTPRPRGRRPRRSRRAGARSTAGEGCRWGSRRTGEIADGRVDRGPGRAPPRRWRWPVRAGRRRRRRRCPRACRHCTSGARGSERTVAPGDRVGGPRGCRAARGWRPQPLSLRRGETW